MRNLQSHVLSNEEECLLLLLKWLEGNGRTALLSGIINECVERAVKQKNKGISDEDACDMVSDTVNDIIRESMPTSDLHHIYGDWWPNIVESWMQDGFETLAPELQEQNVWVGGFMEEIEITRVNENIYVEISNEQQEEIVRQFILEWRRAAFNGVMSFLKKHHA